MMMMMNKINSCSFCKQYLRTCPDDDSGEIAYVELCSNEACEFYAKEEDRLKAKAFTDTYYQKLEDEDTDYYRSDIDVSERIERVNAKIRSMNNINIRRKNLFFIEKTSFG